MGGSALSPDGRTLFVIGDKGLFAIDADDFTLRGHYLPDWTLDSVGINPDGSRLFVVSAERKTVLALDSATGQMLATIHGAEHPWGVLRVVRAPVA
jgi:YVTN family beta-propeller protein